VVLFGWCRAVEGKVKEACNGLAVEAEREKEIGSRARRGCATRRRTGGGGGPGGRRRMRLKGGGWRRQARSGGAWGRGAERERERERGSLLPCGAPAKYQRGLNRFKDFKRIRNNFEFVQTCCSSKRIFLTSIFFKIKYGFEAFEEVNNFLHRNFCRFKMDFEL
jgi:hypothetical protein